MSTTVLSEPGPNAQPVTIALAVAGDMRVAVSLFEEMLRYHGEAPPLPTEAYAAMLEEDGPGGARLYDCLLARRNNDIVGFMIYSEVYDPKYRRCVFIQDLYVTDRCRGQGVGKALMVTLAKRGVDVGWGRIDWRTDRLALETRTFYDLLCPNSFKLDKLSYRLHRSDIEALARK